MGTTLRNGKHILNSVTRTKEAFSLAEAVESYDYMKKQIDNKIIITPSDYSDENIDIISNLLEDLSKPAEEK